MAPGIFAFGAIFIILTTAQSLTTERQEGLLSRFRTTPLTSSEFIASSSVSNMIMALIQVGVIFVMAFAVGYSPDTGAAGIAMAFIGVSIFALTCVGFGLIAASIAKNPEAATGIAFIFIMPQMFLGTFVSATMASEGANTIGQLVPSYYVTDMLTHLFLRGAPVFSYAVLTDLAVIIVTSVVVLVVGVYIFQKYGNR
jgi:ABC-2 type transport system permease protein